MDERSRGWIYGFFWKRPEKIDGVSLSREGGNGDEER